MDFHTIPDMGNKGGILRSKRKSNNNSIFIANDIFHSTLAEEQVIKLEEKKSITYTWKVLKILVFMSFIYTAFVMFRIRSFNTGILIIFAVAFFMIFNKIESMGRRIKELEGK